ncbi:MAG TPA: DNA-3-methyladenine glycosylase I, partial [Actinomycetota bacterium]|nr:DNA-3-methyladenine glycosylase I [Actinomycetota bacterium]
NKRDRYRECFAGFDPQAVACFSERKISDLLSDPGLIRNRLKIAGAVSNARAFVRVQEDFGSFDAYVWRFVDGTPVVNAWTSQDQVPSSTKLSDRVAADLKRRGFRFVGTTICYSFLQATGIVDDHLTTCFRKLQPVKGMSQS